MKTQLIRVACASAISLALLATTPVHAHDIDHKRAPAFSSELYDTLRAIEVECNAKVWASLLGGLLGGTVGTQAADDHQIKGAAAGAAFGALIGRMLGRSMDAEDPRCSRVPKHKHDGSVKNPEIAI
jgi:hypothetical protein